MPNQIQIRIVKFSTRPREIRDGVMALDGEGKPILDHWCEYAPLGQNDKLVVPMRIDHLRNLDERGAGGVNLAYEMAKQRWDYIRPHYEAWLQGEEMPTSGTPISMANFIHRDYVEVFKRAGIRTLEELIEMPDHLRERIAVPRVRELVTMAKKYIESADQNKFTAQLSHLEDEKKMQDARIAQLESQLQSVLTPRPMVELPEVKRGPGRPRKDASTQEPSGEVLAEGGGEERG